MTSHVDVLIVGAGLSGIGAAYRLQTMCPDRSYAILEARDAIGGTWDLFRYPGVRSDSDMHTLGYPFRPWRGEKAIADGASIRDYVRDTAEAYGIDHHIRLRHRVTGLAWSSADARWTVEVTTDAGASRLTCGFLFMCSGYYDYAAGHAPTWRGQEDFAGRIVHPQHWPEGLEVAGKRVVVIGSGATAVTLVPALVEAGADVTMLQRSPSYIVARPGRDGIADRLHRWLPERLAATLTRWKNIGYGMLTFRLARRRPERMRGLILNGVRAALGDDHDVERHFTPTYQPWDQRLCLVPDGDLFAAIRGGHARIVTDRIAGFDANGLRLEAGGRVDADIVVTATGLVMKLLGGATLRIDGAETSLPHHLVYKGVMASDVPNFAFVFGYTNASWTLKSDLAARYVCRLLNHMRRRGYASCVPRPDDAGMARLPMLGFTSGYVERAAAILPRQGDRAPWQVNQNYLRDLGLLRYGRIDDGTMAFARSPAIARAA